VVEHEADVGMSPHGLHRGGQLAWAHEQVVDEPCFPDRREPALDVGAEEPPRIGLVVHLVPDADEHAVEIAQLPFDVAGEVDPADDAEHERRCRGDREQRLGLVEGVARLHDDGAADAVLAK
jgi:hypothetical protein